MNSSESSSSIPQPHFSPSASARAFEWSIRRQEFILDMQINYELCCLKTITRQTYEDILCHLENRKNKWSFATNRNNILDGNNQLLPYLKKSAAKPEESDEKTDVKDRDDNVAAYDTSWFPDITSKE